MGYREGTKRWNKKNPEKTLEIQRKADKKYYKNNKDKIAEQQRKYRQYRKPGAACEILKKHHDDMKDDPESLTTDFMQKIIGVGCDK